MESSGKADAYSHLAPQVAYAPPKLNQFGLVFAVSCTKFSPCHSSWSRLEVSPSQAKNGYDLFLYFLQNVSLSELHVQYLYLDAAKHVDTLALQALDLVPTKIHERSPIFLGSYDDVEEIKVLYAEHAKSSSA